MKHDKTAGSRIVCALVYISGFETGTKNVPYGFLSSAEMPLQCVPGAPGHEKGAPGHDEKLNGV